MSWLFTIETFPWNNKNITCHGCFEKVFICVTMATNLPKEQLMQEVVSRIAGVLSGKYSEFQVNMICFSIGNSDNLKFSEFLELSKRENSEF